IDNCIVTFYNTGKVLVQGKNATKIAETLLEEVNLSNELILGIDEAGRGESFGSLAVCGVLAYSKTMRFCRDSKKISKARLNELAERIKQKSIAVKCIRINSAKIDSLRAKGKTMNRIIADAIDKIIDEMKKTGLDFEVRIDGSPLKIKHNAKFIVGGDDKDAVVAAASIIAKFERQTAEQGKRLTWKSKTN
ncbi:MAG: hypothetical protein J7L14_00260, partial [Candidatus Diapherotrites archaeon]|nr:hypothetical protein [Candidatus Diapherotrites archaeon]